nr:hypothetical protein L204_03346 [Cryptococcus depauperatus CBS 7855]
MRDEEARYNAYSTSSWMYGTTVAVALLAGLGVAYSFKIHRQVSALQKSMEKTIKMCDLANETTKVKLQKKIETLDQRLGRIEKEVEKLKDQRTPFKQSHTPQTALSSSSVVVPDSCRRSGEALSLSLGKRENDLPLGNMCQTATVRPGCLSGNDLQRNPRPSATLSLSPTITQYPSTFGSTNNDCVKLKNIFRFSSNSTNDSDFVLNNSSSMSKVKREESTIIPMKDIHTAIAAIKEKYVNNDYSSEALFPSSTPLAGVLRVHSKETCNDRERMQ